MTAHTPPIVLQPCESSQIHAHGYCPITNRLHLQFKGKGGAAGSTYEYLNVTDAQYKAFCAAPSKGKYFGQFIKGNPTHPHRKLG